jgi:hypothetical protein
MNYQWSKSPQLLADRVSKAMAGLSSAICLGSAVWYIKEGDHPTGGFLAIAGSLQTWAVLWNGKAQKQL